eukprot:4296746-Prymnesium_polylepis.1
MPPPTPQRHSKGAWWWGPRSLVTALVALVAVAATRFWLVGATALTSSADAGVLAGPLVLRGGSVWVERPPRHVH